MDPKARPNVAAQQSLPCAILSHAVAYRSLYRHPLDEFAIRNICCFGALPLSVSTADYGTN